MSLLPLHLFRRILTGRVDPSKLLQNLRHHLAEIPTSALRFDNVMKGVLKEFEDDLEPFLRRPQRGEPVADYLVGHFRLGNHGQLAELWQQRDYVDVGPWLDQHWDFSSVFQARPGNHVFQILDSRSRTFHVEVLEGALEELRPHVKHAEERIREAEQRVRELRDELDYMDDPEDVRYQELEIEYANEHLSGVQEDASDLMEMINILEGFVEDPYRYK